MDVTFFSNLPLELRAVSENLRREKVSVEEQIQDCKTIKSEMNILAEKKEELEKEMILLRLEKDSISLSLDGALCKISQLERRQEDQGSGPKRFMLDPDLAVPSSWNPEVHWAEVLSASQARSMVLALW